MLGFSLKAGYQTSMSADTAGDILTQAAEKIRTMEGVIAHLARSYGAVDEAEKTVEEAVHYYCTEPTAFIIDTNDVRLFASGTIKLKKIICRALVILILEECFRQGVNIDLKCS